MFGARYWGILNSDSLFGCVAAWLPPTPSSAGLAPASCRPGPRFFVCFFLFRQSRCSTVGQVVTWTSVSPGRNLIRIPSSLRVPGVWLMHSQASIFFLVSASSSFLMFWTSASSSFLITMRLCWQFCSCLGSPASLGTAWTNPVNPRGCVRICCFAMTLNDPYNGKGLTTGFPLSKTKWRWI